MLPINLDYNITERSELQLLSSIDILSKKHTENDQNDLIINYYDCINPRNLIRRSAIKIFEQGEISLKVLRTAMDLFDLLPETLVRELSYDSIYSNANGTLIIDWEIPENNDVFSLEVGDKCFGYFSEINGKDIKRIDEVVYEKETVVQMYNSVFEFFAV